MINDNNICRRTKIEIGSKYAMNIHGNVKFFDEIDTTKISVNGLVVFIENVSAEQIMVNGSCNAQAKINCGSITVNGTLKTGEQGVECEDMEVNGLLNSEGALVSKEVSILGTAYAKSIIAQKVSLVGKEKLFNKLFSKPIERSRFEVIKAENIDVDDVTVDMMIGENIMLGANCEIGVFECSGKAYVKKGTVIRNAKGNIEYI